MPRAAQLEDPPLSGTLRTSLPALTFLSVTTLSFLCVSDASPMTVWCQQRCIRNIEMLCLQADIARKLCRVVSSKQECQPDRFVVFLSEKWNESPGRKAWQLGACLHAMAQAAEGPAGPRGGAAWPSWQ